MCGLIHKILIIIINTLMIASESSVILVESMKFKNDTIIKANATVKIKDQKSLIDIYLLVAIDVHLNAVTNAKVYVFAMNRWVEAINIKGVDNCEFTKRYAGYLWNDFIKSIGIKMHSCVVDKGEYYVRNFCPKTDRLGLSIFPKGKLKGFITSVLKENNQELVNIEVEIISK